MKSARPSAAPAVSVLICNYNHGPYLDQCLAGIQRQSLQDLEIVITDDGSTDDSPRILAQLAAADRRIKPVYFPRNRGVIAAVQETFARVRGRLLFCQGVDDFIVSENFFADAVAATAEHPDAAGFFGQAALLSASTEKVLGVIGSAPGDGFLSPADICRGFVRNEVFIPGSACLWRTELLRAAGGFEFEFGPQLDFVLNHLLGSLHGVVHRRGIYTCQRVFDRESNYGSSGTLWEATARLARVETRLRERAPGYAGLEADWPRWRAHWTSDAIRKTGVTL